MDINDYPTGCIRALRSISATAFSRVGVCALKELWSLSGNRPLLPTSPKARVGALAHRLLSEAGKGYLDPERRAIDAKWDSLVRKAHDEMDASRIDRHLVPLNRSVPDIEVKRIRAIQRALEVATVRSTLTSRDGSTAQTSLRFGHEIPVQSTDGFVRGMIDVVVPTADGPVIHDYKTGVILESVGEEDYRIKNAYSVQLRIYAALYAETFDEWPVRLEVVPLSGNSYVVPFDRIDCANLVEESRAILTEINRAIASMPPASLQRVLANPIPTTCAYCKYRPACEPYWSARSRTGDDGWPADVKGVLKEIRILGNSRIVLQLLTADGLINIRGLSSGNRHPALKEIQVGDTAGVFALWQSRPTGTYSETQFTTIYKLPINLTANPRECKNDR